VARVQGNTDKVIQDLISKTERAARRRPQVLFFSATIGDDPDLQEDRDLRRKLDTCLGRQHFICKAKRKDVAGMTHVFVTCGSPDEKANLLPWLLTDPMLVGSAMVFCQNKVV
jgi:superfamily II DNA/RNA helicase